MSKLRKRALRLTKVFSPGKTYINKLLYSYDLNIFISVIPSIHF